MNIGTLLLAFLDPGIGAGFFSRLLAAGVNLVLIFVGVTLLAGMCQFLKKGELSPKGLFRRGRPDRCWMAALACTAGMIALSVLASLSQAQPAQTAGSYSLAELVLLIVSFLDPLLDISHLAHSPSQEFFGLNLIARALILYLLAAALRLSIKRTGELALRFNLYLRKKLQTPPKLPEEGGESGAQETAGGEKSEKDELQLLLGRIAKILLSGGAGVFALFVLGSDDMRQNITDVLTVIGDMLETITVFSNVTPTSGFLSNTFYTLVSIGMVMVYVTAILLFVIFIDTVLKSWQQIRTWLLHKARTMRRGIGAALLGAVSLAAVIGAGVCLQRHPSLRLSFAGGLTEVLGIAANYAVFILAMIAVLMLLVFAISFLALLASFARQTVGQKRAEWEKGFPDGRYWRLAKAAACVVLAGILLVTAALCYENLRVWLMGIFDPAEDGFSPAQVFWHAAGFAALLEGLLLLVSTAAVLAFLLFWGIVEFFLTTRKTVVRTASRLVEETLTELLHTLLLAPFLLSQVLLVVKAVVKTVLQIFTGYRTESDKNNAIFMAAFRLQRLDPDHLHLCHCLRGPAGHAGFRNEGGRGAGGVAHYEGRPRQGQAAQGARGRGSGPWRPSRRRVPVGGVRRGCPGRRQPQGAGSVHTLGAGTGGAPPVLPVAVEKAPREEVRRGSRGHPPAPGRGVRFPARSAPAWEAAAPLLLVPGCVSAADGNLHRLRLQQPVRILRPRREGPREGLRAGPLQGR